MRLNGPPVMHLVKKVLDCLRAASPELLSQADILASCGVDLSNDPEVAGIVAGNAKVRCEGGLLAYKAPFSVKSRSELRALVASRPEGTSLRALSEAYPDAADDAEALVEEEQCCWWIEHKETKDRMLYPRDKVYEVPVDARLQGIWHRMEVPVDQAVLKAELDKAGITPAPRSAFERNLRPDSKEDRKKKRKRDFSKMHVTNVHLWDELFAPGGEMAGFDADD